MRYLGKIIIAGLCGLGLQSCGYVDDYILGKDNTLRPKSLPPIQSKVLLKKTWSAKIGQSHQSPAYFKLKPVTAGHKIYTADTSGRVTALSRVRGKILWTTVLEKGIVSGPTVGNNKVVVSTNEGSIVALSQLDGHQLWKTSVTSEVLAKAALTQKAVVVKTMDGHLLALDTTSGKKLWVLEHGAPNLILKASSSPIVIGNTAFVGYADGKLDAVDLKQGRVMWQRNIAYANGASDIERLVDIDADPLVRNEWLYMASYQGFIGAFDISSGQFVWSKPASVYKNMAMDRDSLYVTDSRDILWAYDLSSGQIKWKQRALQGNGLSEPVLLDNKLIVGDKMGRLHVLDKTNGALIGREQVGAPIYISPSVSHGQILVMTADGVLHAYRETSII